MMHIISKNVTLNFRKSFDYGELSLQVLVYFILHPTPTVQLSFLIEITKALVMIKQGIKMADAFEQTVHHMEADVMD